MGKLFSCFLAFALVMSHFSIPTAAAPMQEPVVRVKLVNYLGNQKELNVEVKGEYKSADGSVVLSENKKYVVKAESSKLSLYEGSILKGRFNQLSIKPSRQTNYLMINSRPYLGSFDFTVEKSLYVRPVNIIPIEEYLKGVVPYEMPASWNLEALKAQAVAARTYAMNYSNQVIDDTINFQVYGGYSWHPNSTKAVDDTIGQVLQYNGRLISAVFSASNGGKTESNSNVWGSAQSPYLIIKEDPFDPKMPWNFSLKKQQMDLSDKDLSRPDLWWNKTSEADGAIAQNIKSWLKTNGYANKDIKIVSVPTLSLHKPTSGGRVSRGSITVHFLVKDIVDSNGRLIPQKVEFVDCPASRVRAMIGVRIMKSYYVTALKNTADSLRVEGLGDGHGVGMSQYGAKIMGEAGKKYREILDFYYPGTMLSTLYQRSTPVEPAVPQDTKAPIISDVTTHFDELKNIVSVGYKINESSKVKVYVSDRDNKTVSTLVNEEQQTSGTHTAFWNVSNVKNGTYKLAIIAVDGSGNKSSTVKSFELVKKEKDGEVPKVSGLKANFDGNTNKITFTYQVNEKAKMTVSVSDQNNKIISYLEKGKVKEKGTYHLYWDVSKIANGAYKFSVSATDENNNQTNATHQFLLKKPVKDIQAPEVKIQKAAFVAKQNKVYVSYSINEAANMTIVVQDHRGKLVASLEKNKPKSAGNHTVVWNVSKAPNGSYTFLMEAVDKSRNKSKKTVKADVKKTAPKDTKAPAIGSVKAYYLSKDKKVRLHYYISEQSEVTIYVKNKKGKIFAYLEKNKNKGRGSHTAFWNVSKMANGSYSFGIIATDKSKNKSSVLQHFYLKK